jgi:hypothetical protein
VPVALCVAFALGLPVLAARALSGACADALGDRIALGLSGAFAPLSSKLEAATPDDALTETELMSGAFRFGSPGLGATASATATQSAAAHAKHVAKRSVVHAVYISSAQVLSLAARRAMPGAAPVRASTDHPAGLQLRGVSALGVGLQDGDVLTEAAGQRASSVALVVGVVLAARARHSSEISGRFYRAGVPYLVSVEQPYPPGT